MDVWQVEALEMAEENAIDEYFKGIRRGYSPEVLLVSRMEAMQFALYATLEKYRDQLSNETVNELAFMVAIHQLRVTVTLIEFTEAIATETEGIGNSRYYSV